MGKRVIIFGSSTGNCETAANEISTALGECDVVNVSSASAATLTEYDSIILGSSTWGVGDVQDDFLDYIDVLAEADLAGKKVAIFGTGDPASFSDSFVDAMGDIYEAVTKAGATVVGFVDDCGYDYDESRAVVDGHFVGLPLDYDNDDETESKITEWSKALKDLI